MTTAAESEITFMCPACALTIHATICPHHIPFDGGDGWSEGNRRMCDFIHRGFVAVALPLTEEERRHYFIPEEGIL